MNNSANQYFSNETDGFVIGGGTTQRKFSVTGADISLVGSGTDTFTFPASSDTLVGRDSTDALTNKTIDATYNTIRNLDSSTLAESARWPEVGRSSTVSSNKISVTLDGTYKYLHIIGHVTNNSATSANVFVRLNGDSGGNYAYQYLTLNNSTVSGTTGTSGTSLLAQSSVGQYELIQIVADIEKFTSLNWAQATGKIGSGANNRTRQYLSSQWQNTTDDITSISVEFDAGTLSGELVVLGHN